MSRESTQREDWGRGGGFGDFVRSLLSGIPWSERAERSDVLHYPRPEERVRIENANGRTRVTAEERDDIEITARKIARAESEEAANRLLREISLQAESVSGRLSLEVLIPGRWNRRGRVDLDVRVPRDLRVDVSAANGRVSVEGLRASVRVRCSNGPVRVEDVIGDVEITATNAKICAADTQGRMLARSSNGKIGLSHHRGSVDASTSNGVIDVALEELSGDGVSLATSNGRIVLELPEDVDGDVDLRVDNGVIRNQRTLCRCTRDTSGRVRGTLGAGGTPIRVRTSNGSISLR